MHKVIIFACCAVSLSCASSNHSDISVPEKLLSIKNATIFKTAFQKVVSKILSKSNVFKHKNSSSSDIHLNTQYSLKHYQHKNASHLEHKRTKEAQNSMPILHKIHARITRSKDAVWATITLTFMCVLLVLAVAQSRMWKDHYYKEAQGVPLPNFNERVLFRDVMERKVKSLKQFFKKRSKEPNETELESLLPPSEWD